MEDTPDDELEGSMDALNNEEEEPTLKLVEAPFRELETVEETTDGETKLVVAREDDGDTLEPKDGEMMIDVTEALDDEDGETMIDVLEALDEVDEIIDITE